MSHPYLSPLSTYNSLTDKHLTGYFNNTRIKRHLQRAGLITRSGRILTEKEYRINAMRRDHQRYIRECLAQAIFHKVLDMERHHQIEIRRKLESFAKKEQVRKTKVDHSKRPDDDALPAFSPRPPAGPRSGVNRHTTTQAEGSDSSESATSPRPNTAPGNMQRPVRLQPLKGNRSALKTSSGSRQKTEDTKFHFSREVDRDIMRLMNTWDPSVGISPYQLPVINNYVMPAPPPPKKRPKQAMSQSLRGRRFRPATAPNGQEVSPKDSGKFHKTSVHSNASITMVYLGKNVHLSHEDDDYRDEIKIFQQHCGGENLCVYKGRLLEGESFTLISRRHRGFPFSLTFYINGIQVDRLSSCCEYKHRKGARLGGKNGYFGFINVEGASPCYRCIISMGLDKKPSPPPKKTEDEEEESEREDKIDEKEDRSAMDCDEIDEKDPRADEKRGRASPSSSSSSSDAEKDEPEEKSGMDYEEEREEEKEDNTDVYEADDEAKDEYDEDFEVEEEKTDEKPNDKGQVDDQSDRKSKSPSYDERDDPEHEGNSNEASKQIPETPDSHVKDERVDQSEGNQPGRRSAAEEEMNSAARKIQSLYRKRRIHQEKNQNMKADCKSVQEKIAEAIGADEGRSSEPEASESSTDEEENVKRSFIPHKPLDEKSERDTPGRVLQIENKETGECYPNETTLHEKGSPITTEPEPSPESTLVEDPENSQSVKEANNLDLEMAETEEMVAENTEKEDEEITDDLKIKRETNEEMDIHDDTNHNDVRGTENRPEHIENGAFNDDLLEEIANMDLEGGQIVISDLNEDKDMGEMTDNEMLESIEVLAKELECEEVQTPTEDSSGTMADSTYSALNATFMTHTEQTLSNVEEESEQNEEVHEEFVIEGDLTDELMEMPLASSPTRMSGTGSAEGAEKSQGRASSDAESVEGNSILMKETSDENEKATGVGSVQERDPVTGMDDITKGAAIQNDSSTNDTKETEETTPYESEQEHDEDKTQVEEVLGSIENGEVIRVSTADVNETVNEVMLEVEDREFVNEVVLEAEEPELDHNLENKPSVREEEESREGDEVTENRLRVRSADAETIKPAGSMEVKDEEGVDRLIADGTKAVGDTGNGDMAPTGYSSAVAVVVNEEGSPADEIKVEDITDDLGSKDGSPDGEGELVLSEAGETINNSEQTEQFDEVEIVEEVGESGKATSEVMDGKTDITVKSLIREEETIPSDSNIQEKEALGDVEETKNADPSDAEVECTYQGIFTEKESSNENVSTSKDPKGSNEDFKSDGKVEGADDSTGKESKSDGGGLETDLNAFGYHTEGGPELSRDLTEKEVKSAAGGTEKELELTGDKIEKKDIYGGDIEGEDVSDKVGVAKDGAFHEGDSERKERNRVEEKEMESNENSENVVTTETGEMDTNLKVLSGEQELSSDMRAVDQEKDNESVNDEMDQRATTEHAEENERGDDSILKNDDETLGSCENEVAMEENLVVSLGTEDPIPKEDDQTTTINREMGEIDRNKGKEDGSQSVSMQDDENPDMAAEDEGKNPRAESPKIVLEEETTEAKRTAAETDGPVALGEVGPHAVTEEEVTKIKKGDTEKQQEGFLGLQTSDIMPGSTTREDISETPKEDNQVVERSPSSSAVQTGAETDGPVALGEVGPHTVTEEEVTELKESHTEQKQKDILGLPTSDIMPGTTTSEDISETPKEDNQVVERSPSSSAVQTGAETEGLIALGEVGPQAVSEGGVTEKKEGDTEQKQKDSLEVPTSDIIPATATREDISETPNNKAEERSLSNSANDGEQ